jgi:flavodoxin
MPTFAAFIHSIKTTIMKKLLLSMAMMTCMTTGFAQKKLVLYYSEVGSTKAVAEVLQKQLGADIEAIECVKPYSGNFQETIQRSGQEREKGETPALKPLKKSIANYDVIFLGYPIWFGTYAMPIATLVKEQDFAGKTIVPFCTFGSGGLNTSSDALKQALPKATIKKGYGVRTARVAAAEKELDRFLKENGYKEGSVSPLPDYSAQQPVTDADKAIFDAACSSYQFPLGTPETVGKRTTDDSNDYKFIVKSRGMNGEESTSTIYVTVGKAAGAKPEFTEVVR